MVERVQYCVILKEGKGAGLKQYFDVPVDKVQSFFNGFRFGKESKNAVDMGYRIGQKKREFNDKVFFYKRNLSSLVLECKNEETANKCADLLKFPLPFNWFKRIILNMLISNLIYAK